MKTNVRSVATSVGIIASACIQMGGCLSSGIGDEGNPPDAEKPIQKEPENKSTGPTKPKNPDAKRESQGVNTVTGTLRGGMAGIGGEHTGWQIERTGGGGAAAIEVDVAKIKGSATKLDGRTVTITGTMVDKKYIERGVVKILRAETIAEIKSQRY